MRWTEEELLRMEHPVSKKHPPMSLENRAAQFAPYAALTGFGRIITEAGRQQAAQAQKGDILRESEPESTDQFESDDLI